VLNRSWINEGSSVYVVYIRVKITRIPLK